MAKPKYPEAFLAKLRAVTGKRPRTVIEHILKHGQITTEELREVYGYDHPPRAVRDVEDLGIPIERFKARAKNGRTIAAYRFGDPATAGSAAHAGRRNFSKRFKQQLIDRDGKKCALCGAEFDASFLQIDHKIPYAVAGQALGEPNLEEYMLVCRTCNRGKSWACEHCPNGTTDKRAEVCRTCFWCEPGQYTHIATVEVRRLHLTWRDQEVTDHDKLAALAGKAGDALPDFVKSLLRKQLGP